MRGPCWSSASGGAAHYIACAGASRPTNDTADVDESELLTRLRAGDDAAFDAIFREHYPGVVVTATRLLGERALAEEIAQDVLLELWRRRESLTLTGPLRAYLNQAARNANDGISLAQTAEGALATVTDALQRMRELAVQAQNGSNGTTDRANLDTEYQALSAEITRIAAQTKFNGTAIIGAKEGDTVTYEVNGKEQTVKVVSMEIYTG